MATHQHIKGQNINLLIDGAVVAASSSCDFSISANTTDAAAKDDKGLGFWDNPSFTYYDWSASNESFVVDSAYIKALLDKVINDDATVAVQFQVDGTNSDIAYKSTAVITSLEISAANGDYVSISMSLDGAAPLTSTTVSTITPAPDYRAKLRGKALMVAVKTTSGSTTTYKTIACATSHKLSVSCSTSDDTDKDMNDLAPHKEVTGKSVTLSTENLITDDASPAGVDLSTMMGYIMAGSNVELAFGYYPDSIGAEATSHNWSTPGTVLLEGDFLCTSLSISGQVKSNSTFSADFTAQGQPTVTTD